MLVNKQQDWELYQETPQCPVLKTQTVNRTLRMRCLVVVVLAAAMAMFITVRSANIVRDGYELVQLKTQVVKIGRENDQLRLQIAKLKSPQRIDSIAVKQLGMVVPKNVYCSTDSTPQMKAPVAAKARPDGGTIGKLLSFLKPAAPQGNAAN
jgi:cell division protein FtsL